MVAEGGGLCGQSPARRPAAAREPAAAAEADPSLGPGVQHTSRIYRDRLAALGLRGSMSRTGNPYDNAQVESFLKTLKHEEVYVHEYETLQAFGWQISNRFAVAVGSNWDLYGDGTGKRFDGAHGRFVMAGNCSLKAITTAISGQLELQRSAYSVRRDSIRARGRG